MEKEKLIEILLTLEEKYYELMEKEDDDFNRGQHYAAMMTFSKAARIIANDEYAKEIAEELGIEL